MYIIRNTLNNKVYIGSTIRDINERFEEHLYCSTKNKFRTKLYKAINKIGKDKFYISKLTSATNIKHLINLEKKYIIKYNSINEGYNSLSGGEGVLYSQGKSIEYKGEVFTSLGKLALHLRVNSHTLTRRIRRNLPVDVPIKSGPKPRSLGLILQ